MDTILKNVNSIKKNIMGKCNTVGRSQSEINLVIVTKNQVQSKIEPLLQAGYKNFAENRVKEAQLKWTDFKLQYPNIVLHLIGHLQTNKIKDALKIFDVIETIDREELAIKLAEDMKKTEKFPECYVQINTGNEPQKSGIYRDDAESFIKFCKLELSLPVKGLMCIPPAHQNPKNHFTLLYEIARKFKINKISMGMSKDYEEAISYGTTELRIGRAIFNENGQS